MGTERTWRDFLGVKAIEHGEGHDLGSAIRLHIRRSLETKHHLERETKLPATEIERWFKRGEVQKPGKDSTRRDRQEFERARSRISPVLRRLDAAHRSTVKGRVEHLQRLIEASFPHLDIAELTRRQQHTRKGPQ